MLRRLDLGRRVDRLGGGFARLHRAARRRKRPFRSLQRAIEGVVRESSMLAGPASTHLRGSTRAVEYVS
jgi:hypothetical protein